MTDAIYLRQKPILTDRDRLIRRVERDEISPEHAEAERVRLGSGPLATSPDHSKFDPMLEGFWSLPMILAYLQWRSTEPVREMWDKYRAEVWEWQNSVGVRGYVLRPRAPASLADVDYASSEKLIMTAAEARAWLWRQAQQGKLECNGVCSDSGQRRLIRPSEWIDLHPLDIHGRPVLRSTSLPHQGFDRVFAASNKLIDLLNDHRMYPKKNPGDRSARGKHARAEKRGGPGRQPIFLPEELEAIKKEVVQLLEYHGGLGGDAELRSYRELIRKLEEFVDANPKKFQSKRLVRTTIQQQVNTWVAEWEARKERWERWPELDFWPFPAISGPIHLGLAVCPPSF